LEQQVDSKKMPSGGGWGFIYLISSCIIGLCIYGDIVLVSTQNKWMDQLPKTQPPVLLVEIFELSALYVGEGNHHFWALKGAIFAETRDQSEYGLSNICGRFCRGFEQLKWVLVSGVYPKHFEYFGYFIFITQFKIFQYNCMHMLYISNNRLDFARALTRQLSFYCSTFGSNTKSSQMRLIGLQICENWLFV